MARAIREFPFSLHEYPRDHWARLADDLARTFRDVPFYAALAAERPVPQSREPAALAAWLETLPTLAKKDVRRGFPKGWTPAGADLNASLGREEVILLATSGTTEERVQVLWDANWWDPQERAAMRRNARVARALGTSGYREAILTTPVCAGGVCHIGDLPMAERILDGNLLFLNQAADPTFWNDRDLERMADELDRFAPHGMEADPAYLAALAAWIGEKGRRVHQPAFVQLTYEFTTAVQRRRIARAFDAPAVQLYGSTESGVLFMECEHGRLHANPGHTHAELVDVGDAADGAGRLARVVATTIGRRWMPLVRFDLGDIVLVDPAKTSCPCGLDDGPVIDAVEGRLGDLTWTAAGRPVTPGALDRALAPFADDLDDWRVAQEGETSVRLRFVPAARAPASIGSDAAATLATLYGDARAVSVLPERVAAIAPETSGKYRRSSASIDRAAGTRLSKDKGWAANPVFGGTA